MFWLKKILALLFIFFLLISYSCNNYKSIATINTADTTKINYWKNNFDTLYDKYWNTNEVSYIQKAVVFGDSLRAFENVLLNDTNYRKWYIKTLMNNGVAFNDLGNYIKSKEVFDRYLFLYREYKLDKPASLSYVQLTVANIYSRYGDYKKAALLLSQCLEYYRKEKNEEHIAAGILNLSVALKQLERYTEAENILQQIFELPSLSTKRITRACIELADNYVRQNKLSEAGLQIAKAKQLLANAPGDMGITEAYTGLYNIEGDFQMAGNHPQKALVAYQQSLDSAKKSAAQNLRDREIGKIYIAMGKAVEQLQFSDSALIFYSKALYTIINVDTLNKFSLPQPKDIYAEAIITDALYARANCIINRGMQNTAELENAVNCYHVAFTIASKLLNAFSYDESRLHMISETRKQTEKAIGVCYQLYKKNNDLRWANEAFLFAEHNKAFVLEESVRRNTAASLFLQNDTLYEKMQQLQSNLALTEIELGKQHFSATPDTDLLQSLNTAKQKAEEELLAAENNIRIKNPQYNNWLNEETTLSAEDVINKTIANNTSMIEYFSGDSSLYAFSAVKNKPLNFYKLNDTVKNIAAEFLHFFSNQNEILNNPVQYATVASNLYQSLIGPYLPKGNTTALIIPDGFIAYIPFDALLTSSTTTTNIASFPFLIKQQEIYYAFSCKTLLAQTQIKNSAADNSFAAFAPVFANRERGLSTLPHSNEELEAIKQFYPQGKFLSGNTATLKEFENNCSNASIIHLATHASPGNDSLPARIELYDSSVYINSIYAKKINAKLVVLSGCETGTGTLNKSEGLMSLARGFSYAGTKNVIASLWQTEDNSSAAIFKNFYSNLSSSNFSSALRNAKLSFLNSQSVAAASPYYWSGYIYIGTPEESAAQSPSGKLKWTAVLTSLVLITAYFIFVRRHRQKLLR